MKQPPVAQAPAFDNARLYTWVKSLEAKANNLVREVDLLKNDFLRKQQDAREEIRSLSEEILALRRSQEQFSGKLDLIIRELKQTAGREEVGMIRKYLEYWNPLTFVTRHDLDRRLDEHHQRAQDIKTSEPSLEKKQVKSHNGIV